MQHASATRVSEQDHAGGMCAGSASEGIGGAATRTGQVPQGHKRRMLQNTKERSSYLEELRTEADFEHVSGLGAAVHKLVLLVDRDRRHDALELAQVRVRRPDLAVLQVELPARVRTGRARASEWSDQRQRVHTRARLPIHAASSECATHHTRRLYWPPVTRKPLLPLKKRTTRAESLAAGEPQIAWPVACAIIQPHVSHTVTGSAHCWAAQPRLATHHSNARAAATARAKATSKQQAAAPRPR